MLMVRWHPNSFYKLISPLSLRHAASSYGHEEILKLLLERGGNVNTTDEDGDTALHACESVECAKILLDAGADATLRNDEEKTAAEIAVEEERSEVAELLRIRFPESFDASRVQAPEDEDEAYKARFQHLLQVAQEPEGVRDAYQASFQQLLQAAQAGDESKEKELVQLMERMVEDGTLGIEREDDQEEKEEEGGEEAPRAE